MPATSRPRTTRRAPKRAAMIAPTPTHDLVRGCTSCNHIPLGVNYLFMTMSAVAFALAFTVLVAVARIQSQGLVIDAYQEQSLTAAAY